MLTGHSPFRSLPKVELHLHIDCSVTRTALDALGIGMEDEEFLARFAAPERCRSLKQYLDAIAPSNALMQSAESLRVVTAELLRELAEENVIYAELRFAPQVHLKQGLDLDQVMDAVVQGMQEGCAAHGIQAGLILCALRNRPAEENLKVIELAARWSDRGVVGVDIAGDEAGHPVASNENVFRRAQELGLSITAHAGEAAGADSVLDAIERLAPARIGHGVRSIEDPSVVDLIKARGIHLEVCPSSNIQVGVFPDLAAHSIDRLAKAGVSLGINTDARTVAPVSLSLEYDRLAACFGWERESFLEHNLEAASHAFQPDDVRAALKAQLTQDWAG